MCRFGAALEYASRTLRSGRTLFLQSTPQLLSIFPHQQYFLPTSTLSCFSTPSSESIPAHVPLPRFHSPVSSPHAVGMPSELLPRSRLASSSAVGSVLRERCGLLRFGRGESGLLRPCLACVLGEPRNRSRMAGGFRGLDVFKFC